MPKVGKMRFPYTEQGMKEAQKYSTDSRKPMQVGSYQYGGRVPGMRQGLGGRMRPGMNPGLGRGLGRGIGRRPGGALSSGVNPYGMRQGPGRGMSPAQMRALRNRMARFKKGIV